MPLRGYTLLEMLVALVMFGLITVATSFALTAALRNQQATVQRAEELQEARALLSLLARDLRGAFASQNNPNSLFVAEGNTSGTLLTFTTLTRGGSSQGAEANATPQSDVSIVRYAFDEANGVLSRAATSIPNPDTLPPPDAPEGVLSRRVRGITFQFLDPNTGTRNDWHYLSDQAAEQQAGVMVGRDTALPQAVQVALDLESSNGFIHTYMTTVSLAMPQPLPAGQKPASTGPAVGTGSGGGQQGGGANPPTGGGGGTGGGTGGSGLPGLPGTTGPRG